jgi:hypothetical protein
LIVPTHSAHVGVVQTRYQRSSVICRALSLPRLLGTQLTRRRFWSGLDEAVGMVQPECQFRISLVVALHADTGITHKGPVLECPLASVEDGKAGVGGEDRGVNQVHTSFHIRSERSIYLSNYRARAIRERREAKALTLNRPHSLNGTLRLAAILVRYLTPLFSRKPSRRPQMH